MAFYASNMPLGLTGASKPHKGWCLNCRRLWPVYLEHMCFEPRHSWAENWNWLQPLNVICSHLDLNPDGSYCFTGLSQPTVSIMLKHYGFKTVAKGYRHLDFPDGTHIELHYPSYFIKNVVYTNRPRAEVCQWVSSLWLSSVSKHPRRRRFPV